jgi:hypothetical protein
MAGTKRGCFGVLDLVFPVGQRGLREVAAGCRTCPERTACLRTALSTKEGLALRAQVLDRAAARGMVGRLQRWSRKKTLSRLMEEEAKKRE